MSYRGPVLLGPDHIVAGFDCGNEALNTWLVNRALANQGTGTTRTWVVTAADDMRVMAYYGSATASVLRSEVSGKLGRNQPEQIPAILLARMGVDTKHQHQGLGEALLKHFIAKAVEVSEVVGVRLLLVHAKDEQAKSFYQHFDFMSSPFDDLILMTPLEELGPF